MRLRTPYLCSLILLVMALGAVRLHAGPDNEEGAKASASIWSGLVLATNESRPSEIPPELKPYSSQLKNIFGYNQYELMGQHVEIMDSPTEHWLVPSKDFFSLRVESKKATKPGFHYRMKLDLYQEKKLIAGMEARLCGQNLLFIRGPFYGKGQLIIVMVVK